LPSITSAKNLLMSTLVTSGSDEFAAFGPCQIFVAKVGYRQCAAKGGLGFGGIASACDIGQCQFRSRARLVGRQHAVST
jgi:hypothetical protein